MKGSDRMRIEKLEFNKIKVTVFPVDLIDMNINMKNLKPDSPQLHSFLSDIMEKIKEETGFNPYSERTVVEASPVGDCIVLTVTKIADKPDSFKNPGKRKVKAVLKNKSVKKSIYFFECFDDMCDAISLISEETLFDAVLYKIENKFAISTSGIKENEAGVMREFCSDSDAHMLAAHFLGEHAELIAKGEKLVSMASGIRKLASME